MYDLSSPDFWVVAVTGLVIGLFFGWLIMSLLQRRANGGESVGQIRKEMEGYREEVNSHFARTAELFKDTTEKYRDLYEHLAGGAQELCNDLPDTARVEFRPGHLLAQSVGEPVDLDAQAGASAGNEKRGGAATPAKTASDAASGGPRENVAGPAKAAAP